MRYLVMSLKSCVWFFFSLSFNILELSKGSWYLFSPSIISLHLPIKVIILDYARSCESTAFKSNTKWTDQTSAFIHQKWQAAMLNLCLARKKSLTARNQYSILEFLSCVWSFELNQTFLREVQSINFNGFRFFIHTLTFNAHASSTLRGISNCTWSMPIESRKRTS